MRTKIIIILAAIFGLGAVGAGAYYFIYKKFAKPAEQKAQALPRVIVSERTVPFYVLSFDGAKIWYLTELGKLKRLAIGTSESEEFPLGGKLEAPRLVIWPKEGGNFIAEENQDGHTRYHFYDETANLFVPYAPQVRAIRFLMTGKKVVYDWAGADGSHKLVMADADGSNYEVIADLLRPDYEIASSPVKEEVAIFVKTAGEWSNLILASLKPFSLRVLEENAVFEGVNFSPDGRFLLAARIDEASAKPRLKLYNLEEGSVKDLGFSAAISETAWSKDGSFILIWSNMELAKYELKNSEKQVLYQNEQGDLSPRDLLLHPQKPLLFWRDDQSGHLYSLEVQ